MAADFNPLDTSQRAKIVAGIRQLMDAGLSDDQIIDYYRRASAEGRRSLKDYYDVAGTAIGLQFAPEFEQARNTLGASPILADSGYANRLNRVLTSDLYSRIASDFGTRAADESSRNVGFLRDLYGQRAGLGASLAGQGYQSFFGMPKKKRAGQQIAEAGLQLAGAAAGGYLSRPRASDRDQ